MSSEPGPALTFPDVPKLELLANVARHAGATSAMVDVQRRGDELIITVTDNGIGLPAAAPRRSGTANLGARAAGRSGSFELGPAAAAGTIATWKVHLA
jgi:signal transduction histidine kinase